MPPCTDISAASDLSSTCHTPPRSRWIDLPFLAHTRRYDFTASRIYITDRVITDAASNNVVGQSKRMCCEVRLLILFYLPLVMLTAHFLNHTTPVPFKAHPSFNYLQPALRWIRRHPRLRDPLRTTGRACRQRGSRVRRGCCLGEWQWRGSRAVSKTRAQMFVVAGFGHAYRRSRLAEPTWP